MSTKAKWSTQFVTVLLCALGLKFFYSSASPDELRWILAPTTWLVELLSGREFSFESHAGYMSSDHSFLIAASCAGVNFLITAFLMLTLRKLWLDRSLSINWWFITVSAAVAYLTTLVANAVRIYVALQLQAMNQDSSWLNPNQIHRAEGILVYFGFLLLLFLITETKESKGADGLLRQTRFPLLIYYATTLGLPFINGAYKHGREFWEHSAFVLALPLLWIVPLLLLLVLERVTPSKFMRRIRQNF